MINYDEVEIDDITLLNKRFRVNKRKLITKGVTDELKVAMNNIGGRYNGEIEEINIDSDTITISLPYHAVYDEYYYGLTEY